tara:strand:+ start:7316 stop:8278 length:963 start_codon:yes stop_codon:yes gene_type:complete
MAQQTIGVGSVANDGTGDFIRDAFVKVNSNFTEIYADNFVTNARMADASVKAVELATTNTATSSEDNFVLSYDHASGGFTWISQTTPDGGLIVANESNNRVITSSSAGNGNAEANLTFDGTSLIAGGDGSSGGVTVTDGQIDIRTGTGNVAKMKFYCESSNAHAQTLQAQPHSAGSSAVLTLPSATGTLIATGDSDTVTHSMLENRYTAKIDHSGTGNLSIECDDASVFLITGNVATATYTFNDMKQNQVVDLILSGTLSSAAITFAGGTGLGTTTFNKIGSTDFDTSKTNHITLVCVKESNGASIVNYTVNSFAADTTP